LRTFPGDKRWGALSLAGYGGEDDEAGETKKPITSGSREAFINALGVACCGNAMVARNASRQSPRMAPERQSLAADRSWNMVIFRASELSLTLRDLSFQ